MVHQGIQVLGYLTSVEELISGAVLRVVIFSSVHYPLCLASQLDEHAEGVPEALENKAENFLLQEFQAADPEC